MHDLIVNFWPHIMALIAAGVWLVRLEAATKDNTKAIAAGQREHVAAMERLADQRREDLEAARQSRHEVTRALEGIQGDIKTILGKLGAK